MSILSGYKKFKKYIKTSSGFQLQSLWTSANTVEADDKRTIQTKVGAINGISSSETANSAEIAASTALTNKMNGTINNLSRDLGGLSFGQDAEGNWGYKIGGADPVIPFRRVAYTSQMVTLGDSESAKFTFGTVSGFKLLSYTLKTDFSDRQVYLYVNNVKIDECASGIKTGTYDLDIAQNYKIELRSRWGICSGSISLK